MSSATEPSAALARTQPAADDPVEIRLISAQETYQLRRDILRPGQAVLKFEDDFADSAMHLGAFVNGGLVGIISVFQEDLHDAGNEENTTCHPEGNVQWRIRGFAVAAEMQKKGLGTKLLNACAQKIKERCGRMLWTRARMTAEQFYSKQGFSATGDIFHLDNVGPVRRMVRYVQD